VQSFSDLRSIGHKVTSSRSSSSVQRVCTENLIRTDVMAPASPWQNGFAEQLIGSIRRECLDHITILGEVHPRRILKSYAEYYNGTRTHLSLNKNAPISRSTEAAGHILCRPILGGLHYQYARV
jgi:transposase InsO family protein